MPNDSSRTAPTSPNGWGFNKQIDIFKVMALLVALIGAYFALKTDTDNLKQQLSRAENRIANLERHDEEAARELARLAVLEAQQQMTEHSLSEIKETLRGIDAKVDDMCKEIRAN